MSEQDVIRNTDWIAAHLKPYGFDYVLLDEGYDWQVMPELPWRDHTGSNWDQEKFPHGPKWLTDYIKSKGCGRVWLVPMRLPQAVEEHPDWYLRFKGT